MSSSASSTSSVAPSFLASGAASLTASGATWLRSATVTGARCARISTRLNNKQVVDQPRHALRLLGHDAEELLTRGGIVFGRPAQRFDESRYSSQRRAQLMTGVGDELHAHARERLALADVLQDHQQRWSIRSVTETSQPGYGAIQMSIRRCLEDHLEDGFPAARHNGFDGIGQFGLPRRAANVLADKQMPENVSRGHVGREQNTLRIKQKCGVGQRIDQ